jgi:uncharacterized protein YbaP (TraB family)
MKKKFASRVLLGLVLLLIPAFITRAESDSHILWEVKSESATVYLLGSIHVGQKSLYPLDDVITDAFDRSNYLVVEVDMNKINPFELMKRAYYKDDSLKNHLSKNVYEELKSEFEKENIKESFYAKMKPWFAVLTIMNMKMAAEGFDAASGIDMHFLNKAKGQQKKILELETPEFQITLLDSILGDMQDDFVLYSLEDIDSTDAQVDEMYNAWKRGDAAALDSIAFAQYDNMPNSGAFKEAFVFDRNKSMTDKISVFLESDKTYFVVVGAAHLVGEKGLVNLLKNKNKYKIFKK